MHHVTATHSPSGLKFICAVYILTQISPLDAKGHLKLFLTEQFICFPPIKSLFGVYFVYYLKVTFAWVFSQFHRANGFVGEGGITNLNV